MIKNGIINRENIVEMNGEDLLPYLQKLLDKCPELKKDYELFCNFFRAEFTLLEYFVRVLGYAIIYQNAVYFQEGNEPEQLDKVSYAKEGYAIKKLAKMEYKNNRYQKVVDPILQEIERVGFAHSESEENDLSFWYPKTKDIGFKTPLSTITEFTEEEVNLIHRGKWGQINEEDLIRRIQSANAQSTGPDLNDELFIRLGTSSNKFNFQTCHVDGIGELYPALMKMFNDMYFRLEWERYITLVLREFIRTNYQRSTIYNGMPLNTEFRVFYDFDSNSILGVYNYWDTDTMLENLYRPQDLLTFAGEARTIEKDFKRLSPHLVESLETTLPKVSLKGKWSIDFMYDGENFVLIDMAHAECSYYYDKVLRNTPISK